jgi:DNA primase
MKTDSLSVSYDRAHWEARKDRIRERVSLHDVVSRKVALKRAGAAPEFAGLCPFHTEKTPSFTVNTKKDFYHCFGCGAHGDLFRFVMETQGLDFRGAIELLESENGLKHFERTPLPAKAKAPPVLQAEDRDKLEAVQRIWTQTAALVAGDPVDRYLRGRGLVPPSLYGVGEAAVNAGWPPDLRFHGGLWHPDARAALPAMVAAYRNADGFLVAVHRTWLKVSGTTVGKAGTPRDKMALGARKGAVVRLAPVGARMTGGEGIETSLSAMQLWRRPGLAFGSADAMAAVVLPFAIDDFLYAADWNAKNRTGEKAAFKGKALNTLAGRTIAVKVPNLRAREKADFNDLREKLAARAAAWSAAGSASDRSAGAAPSRPDIAADPESGDPNAVRDSLSRSGPPVLSPGATP